VAAPVPLTDLDAVNAMLHDIGERPVNTLSGSGRLDVTRAINALDIVNRSTQQRGWWFNTENLTIVIDSNGQYNVPNDIVHAEVLEGGPVATADQFDFRLVQRGAFLYDRSNGINIFDTTSEDVVLVCVRLIDYVDLPSTAREYIYCAASIRFQSRTLGSTAVDADLREQARTALTNLQEEDLDFESIAQPKTPYFFNLMYNR
jgi:hypothetical protein